MATYEPNQHYASLLEGKRKDLAATKTDAQSDKSLGG